jgi:hypothetical protein
MTPADLQRAELAGGTRSAEDADVGEPDLQADDFTSDRYPSVEPIKRCDRSNLADGASAGQRAGLNRR